MPLQDVVDAAHAMAAGSGARLLVTDDVETGVRGVDFVYTDVWVSMCESTEEWATRVPLLLPYRVSAQLMKTTRRPETMFMHDQAANRMPTIKAVMTRAFGA